MISLSHFCRVIKTIVKRDLFDVKIPDSQNIESHLQDTQAIAFLAAQTEAWWKEDAQPCSDNEEHSSGLKS